MSSFRCELPRHWNTMIVPRVLTPCNRFYTEVLENDVAAACAQYGIRLIVYSPAGRGMLTGQFRKIEDIPADSLLLQFSLPRFQKEIRDQRVAGPQGRGSGRQGRTAPWPSSP